MAHHHAPKFQITPSPREQALDRKAREIMTRIWLNMETDTLLLGPAHRSLPRDV